MTGEFNGTDVIIQKGAVPANIVGQMSTTMTVNGTPIDISNKSNGDDVTLLDAELAGRQVVFAGTIVYNTDTVFKAMKDEAFNATQDDYTITYPSGEKYEGKFTPSGISDELPHGDKAVTSFTLSSSGLVTRTPAT